MKTLLVFLIVNIVLLVSLLFGSYWLHLYLRKNQKSEDDSNSPSLIQFINRGKLPSLKKMSIGLVFGIVFGFIDSIGIWLGISVLQKYMPGGILTKAGLGNMYSDFLGVTTATFISIVAADYFDYSGDEQPIWLNGLGVLLGCLVGIQTGRLITGKN